MLLNILVTKRGLVLQFKTNVDCAYVWEKEYIGTVKGKLVVLCILE